MPPLEMAPGSFYAARGSGEADELYSRARTGEFSVYESDEYLVFTKQGDDPSMVTAALAMEAGISVLTRLEFNLTSPQELEAAVYPGDRSRAGGILGIMASKFIKRKDDGR